MSSILYYSNYCENCKRLLQALSQSSVKDGIHFICIDKRHKGNNGATYVVLENGQDLLLPPTITKVPALLLLNKGHHVLFGDDIDNHLTPQQETVNMVATKNNGEPLAFSLASSGFGVASDNFSFLDQDSTSLSAKGDGGMRQQHHYATLEERDDINTPPEDYTPDTIGNSGNSMDKMQQERQADMTRK
jgi:hypothetical protein